jgi:hypothetical protein
LHDCRGEGGLTGGGIGPARSDGSAKPGGAILALCRFALGFLGGARGFLGGVG